MREDERFLLLASLQVDGMIDGPEKIELESYLTGNIENEKYLRDILAVKSLLSEVVEDDVPEGFGRGVIQKIHAKKTRKQTVIGYISVFAAAAAMIAIVLTQTKYMDPLSLSKNMMPGSAGGAAPEHHMSLADVNDTQEKIENEKGDIPQSFFAPTKEDHAYTYTSEIPGYVSGDHPGYSLHTGKIPSDPEVDPDGDDLADGMRTDVPAYLTVNALYYLERDDFLKRIGYSDYVGVADEIRIYYLDLEEICSLIDGVGLTYELGGEIDSAIYITLVIE